MKLMLRFFLKTISLFTQYSIGMLLLLALMYVFWKFQMFVNSL